MKLLSDRAKWRFILLALAIFTVIGGGCTGLNNPPKIISLTAHPPVIHASGTSDIRCVATDPDGDELSYTWKADGGSVSGQGAVVTWTAPALCQTYSITVTVSDKRGGQVSKNLGVAVVIPG